MFKGLLDFGDTLSCCWMSKIRLKQVDVGKILLKFGEPVEMVKCLP